MTAFPISLNQFTPTLNSQFYGNLATSFATISLASLYYATPWTATAAALLTIAAFAKKSILEAQEAKTLQSQLEEAKNSGREEALKESKARENEYLKNRILHLAEETAKFNGNDFKLREGILRSIEQIKTDNSFIEVGGDHREIIVSLQAILENVMKVLAILEKFTLLMSIHTPMPATPLCTKCDDPNLTKLLAKDLLSNMNNVLTVQTRTITIRQILTIPNSKVLIIYSQGGLGKRTPEQQQTFISELQDPPTTLFPHELNTEMNPDFCGATYFVVTSQGVACIGIDAPQANQVVAKKWGVYCGPLEDPQINTRFESIANEISMKGGPDLRTELQHKTIVVA
ncbi:MAG: hypothetical protein WC222_06065 [Parachlamydiales bacterium]|jgi:hypothetical protein